jgi:putative transposase
MSRTARQAPGGYIYHVLNRAVARLPLFRKEADYAAFEQVMLEANERHPTRLLAYCLMKNHWHFVIWPRKDDELTALMRWLTHTHVMRWHVAHGTVGCGSLYQGRFKAFPVQDDPHFLTVCRYVERNALTAGVVERAQDWRWSSLWTRQNRDAPLRDVMSDWPIERPGDWVRTVNRPMSAKEAERVQLSIRRNRPFGDENWQKRIAGRLDLMSTMRPRGRPWKKKT